MHVVISSGDGTLLEERIREHAKAVRVNAGTSARIMVCIRVFTHCLSYQLTGRPD